MKILRLKKYLFPKNRIQKFGYLALGFSVFLSILSTTKISQSYPPSLHWRHVSFLNMDFTECVNKANEAANLVFSEVNPGINQEGNLYQLFGNTTDATAALFCVKKERSTFFILTTSSFLASGEDESALDRVWEYMTNR